MGKSSGIRENSAVGGWSWSWVSLCYALTGYSLRVERQNSHEFCYEWKAEGNPVHS